MREMIKKRRLGLIIMSILGLFAVVLVVDNVALKVSESKPVFDIPQIKKYQKFEFEMPDSNISRAIYLNLKSAIAIDNATKQVIYCYNAQDVRPVASISKLLTAMVVLDNYNPDTILAVTREDARRSARSLFRVGDKVRAKDLLHAALLQSDNRAARVLARAFRRARCSPWRSLLRQVTRPRSPALSPVSPGRAACVASAAR